jgi:hypothetical protein
MFYGGIPVVSKPREYISDLDSLPFTDKQLFYSKVPAEIKSKIKDFVNIFVSKKCPV